MTPLSHSSDAPDAHAGHVPRDRESPADAPSALGAHVGRFGAFGQMCQTARRRVRSAPAALARPLRPDVQSSGPGRG